MQIILSEEEVKIGLAVAIFSKTGLRLSKDEFDLRAITNGNDQYELMQSVQIDIKEK